MLQSWTPGPIFSHIHTRAHTDGTFVVNFLNLRRESSAVQHSQRARRSYCAATYLNAVTKTTIVLAGISVRRNIRITTWGLDKWARLESWENDTFVLYLFWTEHLVLRKRPIRVCFPPLFSIFGDWKSFRGIMGDIRRSKLWGILQRWVDELI